MVLNGSIEAIQLTRAARERRQRVESAVQSLRNAQMVCSQPKPRSMWDGRWAKNMVNISIYIYIYSPEN